MERRRKKKWKKIEITFCRRLRRLNRDARCDKRYQVRLNALFFSLVSLLGPNEIFATSMDTKRVKKEICSGSLENVAENNCLSKPPKHIRRIIIETDQLQWKFMSRRKEINFRSIIVEVIPIQLSVLSGLHNT